MFRSVHLIHCLDVLIGRFETSWSGRNHIWRLWKCSDLDNGHSSLALCCAIFRYTINTRFYCVVIDIGFFSSWDMKEETIVVTVLGNVLFCVRERPVYRI